MTNMPKEFDEAQPDTFAFPLAPVQRRMWEADRANPGDRSFNASFRLSLDGPLDVGVLEQAVNALIDRHEVLRAHCALIDGEPSLVIQSALRIRVGVTDLSGLDDTAREAAFDAACAKEAQHAFDLAQGPLIRVGVIRLAPERHVLTLTLHHVVCDGWSIGILNDELPQLYTAFSEGRPSPLADLPIQFGDFLVWQQDWLKRPEIAGERAYWTRKLDGYQRLEVTPDKQRPAGRSVASAIISGMLPRDLTDRLKDISTAEGGTMFITTLAVCSLLLSRYAGTRDIAVGPLIAGRSRPEIEGLVGPFLNHLVFRNAIDPAATFPALLAHVRDTVLEAFANQDVPYEHVLDAVAPAAGLAGQDFYRVNFVCQKEYGRAQTVAPEFCGLTLKSMPSKSQGALYDLNFFMVEREAGWRLSLEYKTDLYEAAIAERMLADFRGLLEQIAARPAAELSELTTPGVGARTVPAAPATLADATGETETFALPATLAQERFWLLSSLSPDSAAFNMVAGLRLLGPLDIKALSRALDLLVARHESLRTTFAEQDGRLCQIVRPPFAVALPLDEIEPGEDVAREARLQTRIQGEGAVPFDLASGPLIRARLLRIAPQHHVLVLAIHHIIGDGQSAGVMQRELWAAYEAFARDEEPDFAELPIQLGDFAAWETDWVTGAEARGHIDFWRGKLAAPLPVLDFPLSRTPGAQTGSGHDSVNALVRPDLTTALKALSREAGATLFATLSAAFGVMLSRTTGAGDVLFGCPVANRRPETEGLIGPFAGPLAIRLDLAGDPTWREVLSRSQAVMLDALDHATVPFELLFKELDARPVRGRNPLFQFYFIYQVAFLQGRIVGDLTVKPLPTVTVGHAFEVQIAMIERPDGIHARLEYARDLLDADRAETILTYYLEVLASLAAAPDRPISAVPRPALPRPAQPLVQPEVRRAAAQAHVAAGNEVEERLVAMWQQVLGRETIGVEDDFFDLGGHSLQVARLVREIEKAFGRRIDISTLAVSRTVRALAAHLMGGSSGEHTILVPLRPTGTKPPLYCVHGGGGHILHYQDFVAAMPADQPIYGVSAPKLDGAAVAMSVVDLARLYVAEIRRAQPEGPYQICGYSFGGHVAYEMATQLAEAGHEVATLLILDTACADLHRAFSAADKARFWGAFAADRGRRYYRRLKSGGPKEVVASLGFFLRKHGARLRWLAARTMSRATKREIPAEMQDNVLMFGQSAREYRPRPFPGGMLLIRATERPPEYAHCWTLGWEKVVAGAIAVSEVTGDHLTFMEKPNVQGLAAALVAYQSRTLEA